MKFKTFSKKSNKFKQTKLTEPRLNWVIRGYLYILLLINGFVLFEIIILFTNPDLFPGMTTHGMRISLIITTLNIIFLQLIAKHSKIGFWGYCINALISIAVGYYLDVPLSSALLGLLGVLFLFGLFQLGGKSKAWKLLR